MSYPAYVMSAHQPTDFAKLVPELPLWNNGRGIDIDSWLGCKGDFELAVAFSRLFWPAFVEHDGCVFFAGFSEENYRGFFDQCKGNRGAVEGVMNHRHMLDIFYHAADKATAEQLAYLGTILQDAWQAKLARDFPSRIFEVSFNQGDSENLLDYIVTFWQPANRPGG